MKSILFLFTIFFSFNSAAATKDLCKTKALADFDSTKASLTQKADFYSCLLEKGAYSASIPYLIHLVSISRNKDFQNKYLSRVLDEIPREYESRLFTKLYKKTMKLTPPVKSNLMYFFALRSFDKGNTKTALRYLNQQQGTEFNRYAQSKFLKGVIYFKRNKVNSAEAQFELLSRGEFNAPSKEVKDKIVNSSLLNLARIQITKADYKDAIENYRAVSFKDSQWFDGLIEMSWIMLSRQDYEGAIGNAEFIRKSTNPHVYKPWLSVIQSVGLLKLCQFPDAKRSLEGFQTQYTSTKQSVKSYVTKNKSKPWYTSAVKTLETKMTKSSVKTTPSILFYAARAPEVLAKQNRINDLLDEDEALKKIKRKVKNKKASLAYQLINRKINELDNKINRLENQIGKLFKDKIYSTLDEHKKLRKIADIVDFEIFARSSNSITLRVAGAKFKDKMKKTNRKESSWAYVGEFWTDEVGKFRSFIKNKCVDNALNVSKK